MNNGTPVGKDADHVGASSDLSVESLQGVVGPDLSPDRLGESGDIVRIS